MKTFFTADLHHLHKRIVELTARKEVTDQEHHTEWLIDLINSRVSKQDKLYLLGDICFSNKYEQAADFYRKLNGQKFVVKGNHDDKDVLKNLACSGIIQAWYDYKELNIERRDNTKQHICMMHFPIAAWHKQHYGSYMLHGHSHGAYHAKGRILDVGIDSSYQILGKHSVFDFEEVDSLLQTRATISTDGHEVKE